jgi:hypothetical protein
MARLVLALLVLGALGWAAYGVVTRAHQEAEAPVQVPTQRLEAAQKAAKRIEAEQDKRTDEAQKAADGER